MAYAVGKDGTIPTALREQDTYREWRREDLRERPTKSRELPSWRGFSGLRERGDVPELAFWMVVVVKKERWACWGGE